MRDRSGEDEREQLLASWRPGTAGATGRRVERTYPGIYALLRRLSGDPELALDLTQETYRKAWASLPASTAGRSSRPSSDFSQMRKGLSPMV